MNDAAAVLVPQMNPNDDTAVLVAWHLDCGAKVTADQALCTLETSKATFDVHAPRPGYAHFSAATKSMVNVGSPIVWISDSAEPPHELLMIERPAAGSGPALDAPVAAAAGDAAARASRKALKLMREQGLTASDFAGTARIEVADVERVLQSRRGGGAAGGLASQIIVQPTVPPVAAPGAASQIIAVPGVEALEQSATKLAEVRALGESWRNNVPSTVSVALSSERLATHLTELALDAGPVSLLEAAIYQVARLLRRFPELNGVHEAGKAWRHRDIAVGFAINLGRSLRVPVVRESAQRSLRDVAGEVRNLSLKYLRNELQVAELVGGSFTVTDLSGQGVTHFVPVINQRQSAVLGICAPRPGSGYQDLVLTFDHRMSDGMQAAAFLGELRDRLEGQP